MKATPILEELKIAAEAADFYLADPADALQVQNAADLIEEDVVPAIYEVITRYNEMLAALKCALADLEGSLQAHNQTDWYAHDWEAHQQSIDEARAAIDKATK